MDNAHYNRLKAKAEQKYTTAKEVAEREYAADIEALSRVSSLDDEDAGPEPQAKSVEATSFPVASNAVHVGENGRPQESKGAVLTAVRSAVKVLPQQFTWMDVGEALGSNYKESSVRQAVKRMVELNEIVVATPGSGRSPSIYQH